jgi:hypothetical protein
MKISRPLQTDRLMKAAESHVHMIPDRVCRAPSETGDRVTRLTLAPFVSTICLSSRLSFEQYFLPSPAPIHGRRQARGNRQQSSHSFRQILPWKEISGLAGLDLSRIPVTEGFGSPRRTIKSRIRPNDRPSESRILFPRIWLKTKKPDLQK